MQAWLCWYINNAYLISGKICSLNYLILLAISGIMVHRFGVSCLKIKDITLKPVKKLLNEYNLDLAENCYSAANLKEIYCEEMKPQSARYL